MSLTTALQALQARWSQLAPREKNISWLAALLVLGALLWLLILAPALATLRGADAQTRTLDAQLRHMQALQAQAQALQKQPALGFDEGLQALTSATKQTLGGSAQLNVTGDNASVTLKGASADALAQWLTQARLNARSVPVQARLTSMAAPGGVSWSGVLLMALPPR